MPIWPFKKKRRKSSKDGASQPLTEKEQPKQPTRSATYPPAAPTAPIPIPRRSSKRGSQRKGGPSQDNSEKPLQSIEKENVPPASRQTDSREDITALPMSRQLANSPHLRPVDIERPHIPYNFRQHATSQTSIQREDSTASPRRPNTLKKRQSNHDSGTPQRRQSSRKRKDDHLREEEIRAMSAQIPVPKRAGDGPLRRDSKKMRSLGLKESAVSLPQETSFHSPMSEIVEQHGWEIGSIDVFNPRPAVRLSGTPQYVTPGSLPGTASMSPQPSLLKEKEKMPASRDSEKKRETIGNRADDFDATDIRMLLERDAKRREIRKKEQQDKLDRKLRNRAGRNRADSDRKRREAEEVRRAEQAKQRAEEEQQRARALITPPTDIHPALRDTGMDTDQGTVGLGIGEEEATLGADPFEGPEERNIATTERPTDDPFADPQIEQAPTPSPERGPALPGAFSPMETPMEDPVLETAQAVRMSQASTPPLSPVYPSRTTSGAAQNVDTRKTSELPAPPPITESRSTSDPKPERRVGPWAAFFRRGGANSQKGESPPSEPSFSNTSRESMRNQPLPAHLVDTQAQRQVQTRTKSGTPVRTQSRFREDLPEMPISPPDSRMGSPDVATAGQNAASALRGQRSPVPVDISRQGSIPESGRNDTPMSPSLRSRNMMSASLASVDSEGSWLASGSAKRHSTQSALSRRRPEFNASYEELGGDTDAQHFSRGTTAAGARSAGVDPKHESYGLPAPTEEASEPELFDVEPEPTPDPPEPTSAGETDPMTVHESVRRQPTLVHRDPRIRSREGLLTEFSGGMETPVPQSAGTGKASMELDSEAEIYEPNVHRATSVDYGKGHHARQISAGSAKLLDVRRPSVDVRGEASQPSTPRL